MGCSDNNWQSKSNESQVNMLLSICIK
jgi:hypothetical protein